MTEIEHYSPGNTTILCGNSACAAFGSYTDDPHKVRGCKVCVGAAAEDLADKDGEHMGVCLYCHEEITAVGGVAWRRATNSSCPCCGIDRWR